ncbi:MAG TPA: response regulator transcription factor [Actinomycetota bacterium]
MRRLVIVDDHEGFRRAARAALEDEGYTVVGEAGSGAEALAAVARLAPDVVLLDIQLPDMSGFQLAERIAAQDRRVLLISSRPAGEYRGRLAESTVAGFIAKHDLSRSEIERLLSGNA